MLDNKSMEEQLKETFGAQRFRKLKEDGAEKMRLGIELTLREDIVAHPDRYPYPFPDNKVPRAIQILYRDLIRISVLMETSGHPYGIWNIDNILVDPGGRLNMVASPGAFGLPTYRESLYRFATVLHPPGNAYPVFFTHFLDLLARVENVEQLKRLYYHPALEVSTSKGLRVFDAYLEIGHKARTDPGLWRRLEERMGEIDIEHSIHGHEFYEYVFYTYRAEYSMNLRGLLCYYKDVLEYTNDGVEQKNEMLASKYEIDQRNASDRASAAAREQGLDDEETEASVAAAVAAVPEPIRVARYSLKRLVEDMEQFFPTFLIMVFVFLIEEDIYVGDEHDEDDIFVSLLGRPQVPTLPLHVSRGPPRPTCSLM